MSTLNAHTEDGRRVLRGIAIPFLKTSVDLGGFVEQFAPSSVDRTLQRGIDVRALSGHEPVRLLGRVTARTLQIGKDRRGLHFELDVPDTTDGRDVFELVKRRDLTGASFAFTVVNDGETWDFSGRVPLRTVTDALIREISIVSWPAYPQTHVDVQGRSKVSGNRVAWLEKWSRNRRVLAR